MEVTLTAIKAWASTKQPDESVGVAGHLCGCPVARFIRETGSEGDCVPRVFGAIAYDAHENSLALDDYVQELIFTVDNSEYEWGEPVPASWLIEAIQHIEGMKQ